jgi:Tol biopolymer transport system component
MTRTTTILAAALLVAATAGAPAALGASTTPAPSQPPVLPGEPWLLYQWFQEGKDTKDLFLARPDGSDAHAIVTDVPGEHKGGTWSPDGSRIAFTMFDAATPDGSIWTANADGSGAKLLFDGGDGCVAVAWPSWSPDGTKLVMVCWPDYTVHSSVAVLDIATLALTTIATASQPEFLDNPPRWSPDGASIAFPILRWDPTGDHLDGSLVAIVPAAGGQVDRITAFDTFMSSPDWRPDGSELAMNSYDLGNIQTTDRPSNLYAIRPDGTGLRQLTFSSVDGSMRITVPHWAADGTRIVVSVADSVPPSMTVDCVRPGFVDAAGGEPVVWPGKCGADAELRPTP